MHLPPPPQFVERQRFAGRFWNTATLMDILAVYHGVDVTLYPCTWKHRTLIAVHREVCEMRSYRKGYGKDWKYEIKPSILEFQRKGTFPVVALPEATRLIREASCLAHVLNQVKLDSAPLLRAAE